MTPEQVKKLGDELSVIIASTVQKFALEKKIIVQLSNYEIVIVYEKIQQKDMTHH